MIFDAQAEFFAMLLSDLDRRFTPAELVDLTGSIPAYARPGETYRYSNADDNVLGQIAERIFGLTFATLLA
jgi:CubicO group peptidase (beta-lactamase class C family)